MSGAVGPVGLIAGREITSRLQQKGFRIGFLVTLLIVGAAALLPKFIGGGNPTYDIGSAGSGSTSVRSAVSALGAQRHLRIRLHEATSIAQAEGKVTSGDWDVALIDDARIVTKDSNSIAVQLVQSAYASVTSVDRLQRAGLDPAKVSAALDVPGLPVTVRSGGGSAQRQAIATITVVVLFGQLITFCTWVGMGVVEEKASRVVELILATVRPWQLLAGKLVGIGAIAVGQLIALAAVGLGVAVGAGTLDLPGSAVATVAATLGWFVLGFGFFAALAAAMASLVSRQEEVSGVLFPVSGLLMLSYILGFGVVSSPDSTVSRVLSVIPPVSAIAMPARLARGGVPLLDVAVAVVMMLVVTAAVIAAGAKIYRAAVLHTGNRLKLRTAWRAEAVADLD